MDNNDDIATRIFDLSNRYIDSLNSKIQLDENYQKKLRLAFGYTYDNFSIESRYVGSQGLDPEIIKEIEKMYGFDKPTHVRFLEMVKKTSGLMN